jgi:hypothetical protein
MQGGRGDGMEVARCDEVARPPNVRVIIRRSEGPNCSRARTRELMIMTLKHMRVA